MLFRNEIGRMEFKREEREAFTDHSAETAAKCVAAIGKRAPPATKPASSPPPTGRCPIEGNISQER